MSVRDIFHQIENILKSTLKFRLLTRFKNHIILFESSQTILSHLRHSIAQRMSYSLHKTSPCSAGDSLAFGQGRKVALDMSPIGLLNNLGQHIIIGL